MPFPLDYSGVALSNKVTDEHHFVQPPGDVTSANFIVPDAAPFFKEGLKIYTGPGETGTRLIEGQDFILVFNASVLTHMIGKVLYGGIKLVNRDYTANLYVSYQTLGGDYTLDDRTIITDIFRSVAQVSYYTWDMVQDKPVIYEPAYHLHESSDDTMQQVIEKLQQIHDDLLSP